MIERLRLRRYLYEQAGLARGRRRRMFRRQALVLSSAGPRDPDDGSAGVREPRRPHPPASGPAAEAVREP